MKTGFLRAASGLALLASVALSGAETTSTRPNVLWITCEDYSPDFSFYGDKVAYTPNLDEFAKEGCVFDRAFATSPVCAPSRSTIITGVYAATLGTHNMRTNVPLPAHVKTFSTYLRDVGYYCTNNVKTDYNFSVPEGTWDENSRRAHWRNRPDRKQPFFAIFNITATHEGKYKLPPRKFEEVVKDVKEKDRVDPDTVTPPPYFPNTPITRKDWAKHYTMGTQMDIEAGRLLDQLEEDGLSTNTIVFFYSDHGNGMPRSKRWLYDAGLQVPMVIRWPGVIKPGTRNEELVSLIDLAPTMLSVLGLKIPDYMQGRVFLGEKKQPEPKYVFATRDRVDEVDEVSRAARDRRYKYIKNFHPERPYAQRSAYPDGNPIMQEMRRMAEDGQLTGPAALLMQPTKPAEELYDTVTDPHEIKNLAEDPAQQERLEEMRGVLKAWQDRIKDRGMQPEPEDEKRRAAEARAGKRGEE